MQIQDNKKLWFHRRLIGYLCFTSASFVLILAYITVPEKMQHLKEISCVFIGGCFLYLICYAILATIHDANLLPILPKIFDVLKK